MNVVYPLIPSFAHRDFEFLHSIRSLEKHLKEPFNITVIGRYLPLWVKPHSIRFIPTQTGRSKEALLVACNEFNEFLWMNDDIYFLRDIYRRDLEIRRYQQDLAIEKDSEKIWEEFKQLYDNDARTGARFAAKHELTKWKRRLWTTVDLLRDQGKPLKNYSIHGPYLFQSEKLLELEGDFPGIFNSEHVVETAYFNTYHDDWPDVLTNEWIGAYTNMQGDALRIDHQLFLNHNDDGLTKPLKDMIRFRYKSKSQFEK